MEAETTKQKTPRKSLRTSFAWPALFIGVLVGVLAFATYRVIAMRDVHTHYHANFALYINGQRDEFRAPTYYEEVQTCGADTNNPRARVHLHDQNAADVHVHDEGSTWGHLFANLGYNLGDTVLKTSKGTYLDGVDGNKLTFMLNGESVVDVANRVIGDEDVLLISYGQDDRPALKKQYDAVPRTAAQKNKVSDPATCSGSKPLTFTERWKKAFSVN